MVVSNWNYKLFWEKHVANYTTSWSVAFFGFLATSRPFSKCLFQLGNALFFEIRKLYSIIFIANTYWSENCGWNFAAILLNSVCVFQADRFSWEMWHFEKKKWFRGAWLFQYQVLQMFVWFFISKLFQIFVACACTPWGVWNSWNTNVMTEGEKKTYRKNTTLCG